MQEYFTRKSLAELGYTSPTSSLSALKAKYFSLIAGEIGAHREEQMNSAKRGSRGNR